jgi:hypothetical protein
MEFDAKPVLNGEEVKKGEFDVTRWGVKAKQVSFEIKWRGQS